MKFICTLPDGSKSQRVSKTKNYTYAAIALTKETGKFWVLSWHTSFAHAQKALNTSAGRFHNATKIHEVESA